MANTSISSEFTLATHKKTNRQGPVRWILSHAARYWYLGLALLLGAIGNAGLATVVPVYLGEAFNQILEGLATSSYLVQVALIVLVSQLVRSILQFGRNFGAELLGQNLERDIRDELYVSLLGKSMTFHSLQPVGDIMARATNDVREINLMFNPGINLVVGSAIFMIMPLIFAPRYNPALMITPGLYIIAYILAIRHYLKELQPVTTEVRKSFGALNSRLAEAIDSRTRVVAARRVGGDEGRRR